MENRNSFEERLKKLEARLAKEEAQVRKTKQTIVDFKAKQAERENNAILDCVHKYQITVTEAEALFAKIAEMRNTQSAGKESVNEEDNYSD